MGISLSNEETGSVLSKNSGERKLRRKEKRYEIEQLMKEKRSEEYEVLEETAELSQSF